MRLSWSQESGGAPWRASLYFRFYENGGILSLLGDMLFPLCRQGPQRLPGFHCPVEMRRKAHSAICGLGRRSRFNQVLNVELGNMSTTSACWSRECFTHPGSLVRSGGCCDFVLSLLFSMAHGEEASEVRSTFLPTDSTSCVSIPISSSAVYVGVFGLGARWWTVNTQSGS